MEDKVEVSLKDTRTAMSLFLQALAAWYIESKKGTPEAISMENANSGHYVNSKQGVALHTYLMEEYQKMGLDLIKEIEKTGEEVKPGFLSAFEVKILSAKAIEFMGVFNRINKFKNDYSQKDIH